MLKRLELRLRRLRDKILGRKPRPEKDPASLGRSSLYWTVAKAVHSVFGNGRMLVTMPPDSQDVVIQDGRWLTQIRISQDVDLPAFSLHKVSHGATQKLGRVDTLQAAIYRALRALVEDVEQQGSSSGQARTAANWVPLVDGQRVPRMLRFGDQWTTALHRSGWGYALEPLKCLHDPRGVLFDGFLEATFCWSKDPVVYDKPWVGFVHNPPHTPQWAGNGASTNHDLIHSQRFVKSRRECKGLFVLSEYHREALARQCDIPISVLCHPTETPERKFTPTAFERNPQRKLIQIGHWLRNPNSLYQLSARGIRKARLDVGHPWEEGVRRHLPASDLDFESVSVIPRVSNEDYDELLSQNLVFLHLIDASANNALVECIVRNTPVLVNPHPAVVEYLGSDYPFYFQSLAEAAHKVEDRRCVQAAYEHLAALPKQRFTQEAFLQSFVSSEVYRSLLPQTSERTVIFAHARSGSSSLRNILNVQREFRLIGEPFNPSRGNRGHDYRSEVNDLASLDRCLDELLHYHTGMKHLFYQFPRELNERLIQRATRRILLHRRNTLQAVVSGLIAKQTKIWAGSPADMQSWEFEPLDIEEIGRRVRHEQETVVAARQFMLDNQLPFVEVTYEELFDPELPIMEKLLRVRQLFRELGCPEPNTEGLKQIAGLLDPEEHKLNSVETYSRIPNVADIDEQLASPENGYLIARPQPELAHVEPRQVLPTPLRLCRAA